MYPCGGSEASAPEPARKVSRGAPSIRADLMGSDLTAFTASGDQSLEHFRAQGWMRVAGAFSAVQAGAMRDVVWEGLAG